MAGDAKITVDKMRKEGLKVGLARIRVFRPFPAEEIRKLAEHAQMLATIDRHVSFGMEGFLAAETKASLFSQESRPLFASFIAGLGGRDVTFETIEKIARKSVKWMSVGKVEKETLWVDLRR
jgi:pyruvate ferredoxin oxidoreductase alpha subunit